VEDQKRLLNGDYNLMNTKIEAFARQSRVAELYDRYHEYCVKNSDDDIIDYDEFVNGFAELIINECVSVCLSQCDPQNLNYKPSVKFADEIKRHFW